MLRSAFRTPQIRVGRRRNKISLRLNAHRIRGVGITACMTIILGGCASLGPKTEGVSGPIAWRVSDLSITTREVNGRPVDTRTFTLVLQNASSETITLTSVDETRFQPGASPGYSKRSGHWVIEPGR